MSAHTTTAPASPVHEFHSRHASDLMDGKKRKYEEASNKERYALYEYHRAHPNLKQRELAEWFMATFNRQINQSTVSRNLKKFKVQPPSRPGDMPETAPHKRERKPHSPHPQTPHTHYHHSDHRRSSIGLPPTPPPQNIRNTPIDGPLYEYWAHYRSTRPNASEEDVNHALKYKARELFNNTRPLPLPEVVDEAWIIHWKQAHGNPPPSPASFGHISPRISGGHLLEPGSHNSYRHRSSRSSSSEPRSPVSTLSSSSRRHEELPPVRHLLAATKDGRYSHGASPDPVYDAEELQSKVRSLQREIEKREERIRAETEKRDRAVSRLRELQRIEREASTGPRLAPIQQ